MKSLQFTAAKHPPMLKEASKPVPHVDQSLVSIQAVALNHRDVWITQGKYPGLKPGTILGSDGVGSIGNKPYLINPNINWGPNESFPSREYQILGMPTHGTFAEFIVVDNDRLVEKPDHLTTTEAAALPLAGLTAFRVLFSKCQIEKDDHLCVSGIGGGVATLVFQFALAVGAKVWVTSSSPEKIEKAISMGAAGGQLYTESEWSKKLKKVSGGFDVIVDSAGGPGFQSLISMARPGARVGIYGGTRGPFERLSPQQIFWKQISIYGSTMGSDREFIDMVRFVGDHKIRPLIDSVYSMTDGPEAFRLMEKGHQMGKIVMKVD